MFYFRKSSPDNQKLISEILSFVELVMIKVIYASKMMSKLQAVRNNFGLLCQIYRTALNRLIGTHCKI